MPFTIDSIPDQSGKIAVITGTGGLGYETALALAGKGATTILAGRNANKGAESVARIRTAYPKADIAFAELDLASLASVAAFADRFAAGRGTLDLLINNAGVMALPQRQTTADGFEMQFGTNYLGHFALTAHLLPLLIASDAPRIVQLSSGLATRGKFHFDDLNMRSDYSPMRAYAQSKLAMLVFAFELQRRSDREGWGLLSAAAHPGFARTDLIPNGPGENALSALLRPMMSQTAAQGALPTLFAATSSEARPGGYYGPNGLFELFGAPKSANIPRQASDLNDAVRLWTESERLTGVSFPRLARAA